LININSGFGIGIAIASETDYDYERCSKGFPPNPPMGCKLALANIEDQHRPDDNRPIIIDQRKIKYEDYVTKNNPSI